MDLYQLNGLTPLQLHTLITKSPIGFSAEDRSIQYLGQHIQLHDGTITLSEQIVNPAGTKQLFERLVTLQPDLEALLPSSKADAIQMVAENLVTNFHYGALEKSPTKEVQFAVFVHCMKSSTFETVKKLSRTNSLSVAEKLRFMLAAAEEIKWLGPGIGWHLAFFFPFSIRLKEAKNLFQPLPDTSSLADEVKDINEYLTESQFDDRVKDRLLEIRNILKFENNEISSQLLNEVDNIEKKFIQKVDGKGFIPTFRDRIDFRTCTRRLLYLYAACSGFSQKADIAELTSYIRSILNYTTDSDSICHMVKELAYLSKQPGCIDYCRYIDAVANILKTAAPAASQFKKHKQISDINGFALLESHKALAPYLAALRASIDKMTPEYSQVLFPEVTSLEREFADLSLPEDKPAIKAKVHRLLLVIAACKSSTQILDTSVLALFVRAIMKHGNKKDLPYLISGLTRLVQSTPKIQQILGGPDIKGGYHLRLAPLQLLAFVPDTISEDDLEELCKSLQASVAIRRSIKDGKVFHQWLATLEQALNSKVTNKATLIQILKKLTKGLTYEKLSLLDMTFKLGSSFNEFLDSMGLSCQKEGLPLSISEKGAEALEGKSKEISQWLFKQRHYHLLLFYMASMTEYCNEHKDMELIPLIHEFIQTSSDNTFIENRQSPINNPHLEAVYKKYPQFRAGWRVNFSNFSKETRNKLLSPGETLELTENPWDLFISGLEVQSCQSPDGDPNVNSGLLSYVMDGRNAMIARKNKKGRIISRSFIRMVLDQNDHPALFLEKGYPEHSDLLFIDAAREIADEMKVPLYHRADSDKGEEVKLLEGRAPVDHFDSVMGLVKRKRVTFTKVQRDIIP